MRQREAEVRLEELLDVWPADVGVLLDLSDLEDLWEGKIWETSDIVPNANERR